MKFKCPYCFVELEDNEVLFRLNDENILKKLENDFLQFENQIFGSKVDSNGLQILSWQQFEDDYTGSDRQSILNKKEELSQWLPKRNDIYETWWERYGGVPHEMDTKRNNPIIDPKDPNYQVFLEKQGQDYYLRNTSGFCQGVRLKDTIDIHRSQCTDRVCPHCHNPLPDGYGSQSIKIIAVIGITASGKTVYLSTLLSNMRSLVIKCGLTAYDNANLTADFVSRNRVHIDSSIPQSTPFKSFQPPLYFEVDSRLEGKSIQKETFVIYDIAGENFEESNKGQIANYVRYIRHADGIIFLVDPMQIEDIVQANTTGGKHRGAAEEAIHSIHAILSENNPGQMVETNIAVCLPKSDMSVVQDMFAQDVPNGDLIRALNKDVQPIKDNKGINQALFNAVDYNKISEGLTAVMNNRADGLHQYMYGNFINFNYFAFTALGCDVEVREDGKQYPASIVQPRRIVEPLLWLFYRFGYIGSNENVFSPARVFVSCPVCGKDDTEEKVEVIPAKGILAKVLRKVEEVNYKCNTCQHQWYHVD
ncbi:TPA: hypothetical protein U0K40_001185 [Streptococcus suis]|nr:hypothetical protein [Streptococcus suis]